MISVNEKKHNELGAVGAAKTEKGEQQGILNQKHMPASVMNDVVGLVKLRVKPISPLALGPEEKHF